jgi:lipopolysaccharide transport system permease protein
VTRFIATLWHNRTLIGRLARREFEANFRGSLLGLVWAAVIPLAMLGVYSLVFGAIFGSRWPRPEASATAYAFPMIMFSGLILFGLFSEPINRAPGLVLESAAYVKKVIFPLEILPIVALINAATTAGISFIIFLIVFVSLYGLPPATALLLPLIVVPILLFTLGFVYIFASLGVFLRDLKNIVAPLTTLALFLAPIFYSMEAVPPGYRTFLWFNPITTGVLQLQQVMFWGSAPGFGEWFLYFVASLGVFGFGAWWFVRTKKAFADVI